MPNKEEDNVDNVAAPAIPTWSFDAAMQVPDAVRKESNLLLQHKGAFDFFVDENELSLESNEQASPFKSTRKPLKDLDAFALKVRDVESRASRKTTTRVSSERLVDENALPSDMERLFHNEESSGNTSKFIFEQDADAESVPSSPTRRS